MGKRPTTFRRDVAAVASIEFALVVGPLLLLSLGAFELQRFLRFERQISIAAETIAAMTAQRQRGDGEPPREDLDALQHLVPIAPDWYFGIAYQMTNVVFAPTTVNCKSNCDYTAKVAWVFPTWTAMGPLRRACGPLAKATGTGTPTGATLPAEIFGPGNMIVVDLIASYQPVLGSTFLQPITITRQGFANARFASPYLPVDTFESILKCPDFP